LLGLRAGHTGRGKGEAEARSRGTAGGTGPWQGGKGRGGSPQPGARGGRGRARPQAAGHSPPAHNPEGARRGRVGGSQEQVCVRRCGVWCHKTGAAEPRGASRPPTRTAQRGPDAVVWGVARMSCVGRLGRGGGGAGNKSGGVWLRPGRCGCERLVSSPASCFVEWGGAGPRGVQKGRRCWVACGVVRCWGGAGEEKDSPACKPAGTSRQVGGCGVGGGGWLGGATEGCWWGGCVVVCHGERRQGPRKAARVCREAGGSVGPGGSGGGQRKGGGWGGPEERERGARRGRGGGLGGGGGWGERSSGAGAPRGGLWRFGGQLAARGGSPPDGLNTRGTARRASAATGQGSALDGWDGAKTPAGRPTGAGGAGREGGVGVLTAEPGEGRQATRTATRRTTAAVWARREGARLVGPCVGGCVVCGGAPPDEHASSFYWSRFAREHGLGLPAVGTGVWGGSAGRRATPRGPGGVGGGPRED